MRLNVVAAAALVLVLTVPSSAQAVAPAPPAEADDGLRGRMAGALDRSCQGDPACADPAVRAADDLARDLEGQPRGQAAPAAWIEAGLAQGGWAVDELPETPDLPLLPALLALHREVAGPVDAPTAVDAAAQVRGMDPAAREAVADLVNAGLAATRLVDEATRDADLEPFRRNPETAYRIVNAVAATPPSERPPALQAAWTALSTNLEAVDMARMGQAARVLAEAYADLPPALDEARLDVSPIVRVGAPGDTTHTDYYVVLVDVSGNDTYPKPVGSGVGRPSIGVDRGSGDDTYLSPDRFRTKCLSGCVS